MDKQQKRKEEIVDICFKIIHLWLDNTEKNLAWILKKMNKDAKKKKAI